MSCLGVRISKSIWKKLPICLELYFRSFKPSVPGWNSQSQKKHPPGTSVIALLYCLCLCKTLSIFWWFSGFLVCWSSCHEEIRRWSSQKGTKQKMSERCIFKRIYPPETNIAPENRHPKRKRVFQFQPSMFRCYVSFTEGTHNRSLGTVWLSWCSSSYVRFLPGVFHPFPAPPIRSPSKRWAESPIDPTYSQ